MLTIYYGGDETERKVLTARYFAVNETSFVAWMVLFDDGTVGVQADVPRDSEWAVSYLPFDMAFGQRADGRGTEVNRKWFERAAKELERFYDSIRW